MTIMRYVQAGTFWCVLSVSLRASGTQLGLTYFFVLSLYFFLTTLCWDVKISPQTLKSPQRSWKSPPRRWKFPPRRENLPQTWPGYNSGGYILEKNHEKPTWNHEKPWKSTWNPEKPWNLPPDVENLPPDIENLPPDVKSSPQMWFETVGQSDHFLCQTEPSYYI